MFCFMRDITPEVPANYAVPGRIVFLVKFLFDKCSNVLFDIILLHRLGRTVNRVLLHILGHISIFNHRFPIGHRAFPSTGLSSEDVLLFFLIPP